MLIEMMAEQIGGTGKFAILSATANATNQNAWIEVIESELESNADYANMELVGTVYGDDEDEKSFQETQGLPRPTPTSRESSPRRRLASRRPLVTCRVEYKGRVFLTGLGTRTRCATSSRTGPSPSSRCGSGCAR